MRRPEAIGRRLSEGPLDLGGSLAEQRPLLEALMTAHPLPAGVQTSASELGGVPVIEVAAGGVSCGVLMYFHGGAYALGSAGSAAGMLAGIVGRAGMRGVSVDYRLAPEHPFPAAVNDAVAAYRGLLASGVPAGQIAVAGESAGAGVALALLLSVRAQGLPMPAAAVLFSPWADLTLTGASLRTKASADPVLTVEALRTRAVDYLSGQDPANPLASPALADFTGRPPMLIQAGSHEILLDDALQVANRAAAADVSVTLEVVPGMPHVFQGFAAELDEGAAALDSAGTFLRTATLMRSTPPESSA